MINWLLILIMEKHDTESLRDILIIVAYICLSLFFAFQDYLDIGGNIITRVFYIAAIILPVCILNLTLVIYCICNICKYIKDMKQNIEFKTSKKLSTIKNEHFHLIVAFGSLIVILIMALAPFGYIEYRRPVYIYDRFTINSMFLFFLLAINLIANLFHESIRKHNTMLIWATNITLLVSYFLLLHTSYSVYRGAVNHNNHDFGINYVYYGTILIIIIMNILLSKAALRKLRDDLDNQEKK